MRRLIISTLVALPLLTAAAFAASDHGVVSDVNAYTGTMRLSDGTSYYVPNRVMASQVHEGDVVRIQYDRDGASRVVRDVVTTGHIGGTVITPAAGKAGPKKNFMQKKDAMCKARPDNRNPCFLGT